MYQPTPVLALLGISASSFVDVLLKAITDWLDAGSAAIVAYVGDALDETTSVTFGSAFLGLFGSMEAIGGACALLFLIAATMQALLRQDMGLLVRSVLVRAPVALVGSGIAIWLIKEGLGVTDAFSIALLDQQNGTGEHFASNLAGLLSGSNSVLTGFEGVVLALCTAAAAFSLWIELIVRSAAVLCASLFIPLSLAGVIWPVTDHWIRRLGETLCALVLAKVAMVAVLVLGVSSIGAGEGISGVIEGVAILLLSALAPFALLRMLPFIERGATAHFDGVARGATRAATRAAMGVDLGRVRHPFGGGASGVSDIAPRRDPIPWMQPQPADAAVFKRTYAEVLSELESRARGRTEGDKGIAP